jgi:ABC-type transporter Mla subunit MlaD
MGKEHLYSEDSGVLMRVYELADELTERNATTAHKLEETTGKAESLIRQLAEIREKRVAEQDKIDEIHRLLNSIAKWKKKYLSGTEKEIQQFAVQVKKVLAETGIREVSEGLNVATVNLSEQVNRLEKIGGVNALNDAAKWKNIFIGIFVGMALHMTYSVFAVQEADAVKKASVEKQIAAPEDPIYSRDYYNK